MRQKLIWAAIVLGASYYIFAFFVGEKTAAGEALRLTDIRVGLTDAFNVIVTMALGLGAINLFHVHGGNVLKRRAGWPISIVVFVTFFTVVSFLVWEARLEKQESGLTARTQKALQIYRDVAAIEDPVERDRAFAALDDVQLALAREYYAYEATFHFKPRTFFLDSFISPLAATVMALLGFYITFAAYRAFRIRSLEATVMMISATLMVIGSDAIGGWLSAGLNTLLGRGPSEAWLIHLPLAADFDNRVIMSGMQRGLWIGISIAIIAAGLRMLLGLEKGVIEVRSGGD